MGTFGKDIRALKASSEYSVLLSSGSRFICPLFVALFIKVQDSNSSFGVIASKKVGGAVSRNRCKRVLRVCAKRVLAQLSSSFSVVFISRKALSASKPGSILRFEAELISNLAALS
ncbi:Ribonuclease P protein component [Candidatus Cyrtobacter comes]|uniref:Ribonuclease P protein component n=1 Tax=Candidatus Cyrtobacter comes TaxID=675776 RepID=A0ABU5L7J0_9RICK|nr:ribonuclease P protein component [Candidatus Cyrtobacter comes]MDZ5762096.1 Ribonuclease P protein component [Candidatus Cyrtobacter comes]